MYQLLNKSVRILLYKQHINITRFTKLLFIYIRHHVLAFMRSSSKFHLI